MLQIETPDGPAEAYLARPDDTTDTGDGAGRRPGVLLFMDAIGLRPRLTEMADRIASWGYVVLVPHVFHREGSAAELSPDGPLDGDEAREAFMGPAMERVGRYTPDQSGPDTATWLATLAETDGVTTPVGVIGFCMGARLALRAACDHPDLVHACAGFHGAGLATDAADSPHLGLPRARAELLFGHADEDPSNPAEAVARLGEAMDEAGLTARSEVYPGARHGFTMADTAVYDEGATERAFAELRDLLDRTLHA